MTVAAPTKLTASKAYELNRDIERLIDSKGINPQKYSSSEKAYIAQYSGYGGLDGQGAEGKGILYEYYTPDLIVQKMWALAIKHGFVGGNAIEPSCGAGVFMRLAPHTKHLKHEIVFTGYEISKYSHAIASILFPKATIHNQFFEQRFIEKNKSVGAKYKGNQHLVIGNPPYGDVKGGAGGKYFAMGEDTYSGAYNYDEYFILRGLDCLESGGLLVFIVGAEVANGGKTFLQRNDTPCKDKIAAKSDILEAYRLPNGVFDRTDVLSDIIVLRKK